MNDDNLVKRKSRVLITIKPMKLFDAKSYIYKLFSDLNVNNDDIDQNIDYELFNEFVIQFVVTFNQQNVANSFTKKLQIYDNQILSVSIAKINDDELNGSVYLKSQKMKALNKQYVKNMFVDFDKKPPFIYIMDRNKYYRLYNLFRKCVESLNHFKEHLFSLSYRVESNIDAYIYIEPIGASNVASKESIEVTIDDFIRKFNIYVDKLSIKVYMEYIDSFNIIQLKCKQMNDRINGCNLILCVDFIEIFGYRHRVCEVIGLLKLDLYKTFIGKSTYSNTNVKSSPTPTLFVPIQQYANFNSFSLSAAYSLHNQFICVNNSNFIRDANCVECQREALQAQSIKLNQQQFIKTQIEQSVSTKQQTFNEIPIIKQESTNKPEVNQLDNLISHHEIDNSKENPQNKQENVPLSDQFSIRSAVNQMNKLISECKIDISNKNKGSDTNNNDLNYNREEISATSDRRLIQNQQYSNISTIEEPNKFISEFKIDVSNVRKEDENKNNNNNRIDDLDIVRKQKERISHIIYDIVLKVYPDVASKITGMLLAIDNKNLLNLIESPKLLREKIDETESLLSKYKNVKPNNLKTFNIS